MNLKEHYTTVVVGAGPAGIMAAVNASAAGDVLVVDSMGMPRQKSCGGMLNEYSQRFLAGLGELPRELFCDPEWINFRFFDWDREIKRPTTLRFANVHRDAFDAWLAGMLPGNVDLVDRTRFIGLDQDEFGVTAILDRSDSSHSQTQQVHCTHLIGCDGPRSAVRRALPVSQLALYKTLQEFVPLEHAIDPYFDCIYSRHIGSEYGYGYVIPKDGTAIIGSVFFPGSTGCKELHERAVDVFQSEYGYRLETLKREAWTAVKVNSVRDIVGGAGRVLLAGEAGGIMSPSSGEGISFALNSGRLAGLAAARAVKAVACSGKAVTEYRESLGPIKRNIARRLRYFPVLNSNWGKWLGGSSPDLLVDIVAHRI